MVGHPQTVARLCLLVSVQCLLVQHEPWYSGKGKSRVALAHLGDDEEGGEEED